MKRQEQFIKTLGKDIGVYGIHEAVILGYIRGWCDYNKKKDIKQLDGNYWSGHMTLNDISDKTHIPLVTVRRKIKQLIGKGIIVKGNFNKTTYDRTGWYRIKETNHQPNQIDEDVKSLSYPHGNHNPKGVVSSDKGPCDQRERMEAITESATCDQRERLEAITESATIPKINIDEEIDNKESSIEVNNLVKKILDSLENEEYSISLKRDKTKFYIKLAGEEESQHKNNLIEYQASKILLSKHIDVINQYV